MSDCGPIAEEIAQVVHFGKVAGQNRGPGKLIDPPIERVDHLFWLRDDKRQDAKVLEHLKKEENYFRLRMKGLESETEAIYRELLSHIKETDHSAPFDHGPYAYYTRTVEGKGHRIHCRVGRGRAPGEGEEILLDENVLAEGKEVCDVRRVRESPSHRQFAYSVDEKGNEVFEIRVMSIAGSVVDAISNTNGAIVWGSGDHELYYTTKDEALRDCKIWRHIVGTPQSDDVCIYKEDDITMSAFLSKSLDGTTLIIGSYSTETTEVSLMELSADKPSHCEPRVIRPRERGVKYSVSMFGRDTLIVVTNQGGKINNELIVVDRRDPTNWTNVLVPHSEDRHIENITIFRDFAAVDGREGGLTRVWTMRCHPIEGPQASTWKCVDVPEPVFSLTLDHGANVEYDSSTIRLIYSSLTTPTTHLQLNPLTHERVVVKVKEVGGGFDPSNYVCEQLHATAPDGTRIPISLVRRQVKQEENGKPHPTLLYGYGSYGISIDPDFDVSILPYLDRGVQYAIAHVRGGGDMGRRWYECFGKKLQKRNTFHDFIACAEELINKGRTTPDQLACEGRSAGGLLIGVALNMRPDLFTAAIAGVPFVDVMTTMCDASIPLTSGEWDEWGNPNDMKYFDYMLSYSPIDNVRAQSYPSVFCHAGIHDPRVGYWEPAKWISKLRKFNTNKNAEIIMNMETAGHFSVSDRYKHFRELAQRQAWLFRHLLKRR